MHKCNFDLQLNKDASALESMQYHLFKKMNEHTTSVESLD